MIAMLVLALSLVAIQAVPPPAAGDSSRATCEIRGRVTDQASGLPIARAAVRLHLMGSNEERFARTDDEGRYRFTGLAPGEYDGFVQAGEFRATYLPATLSFTGAATRRRRIVLMGGDVRADLDVALQRARALTVRVVNEWGDPLSGISVTISAEKGGRQFHPWMPRQTDDRGRVRVFTIPPGRYIVCAEADAMSSYIGAASSARRDRFLRTCYPSAAGDAQAEPVSLERSDIEDLEIRMRRGPTFTISGTVLDPSGAAATDAMLNFSRFERRGSSSISIRVDAGGRFTVANVPPGDYAIDAALGGPDRPEQRHELELGFQAVHVDASDIEGIVVAMAKAVEVTGRVVTEDPAAPLERPAGYAPLFIGARLVGNALPGGGSHRSAHVEDDRVFVLTELFGRRVIEVANVPRGWYVKSIRYRGNEIIDVPTEFKAARDPSELEVVLSKRGAVVSGRVLDERGAAVGGAHVVLLPADQSRWPMFELTGTTSAASGAFRVRPVRAGDYVIVAIRPSEPYPDSDDRARLAKLAESGERMTLGDEEQRTLDLHIVKDR